MFGSNNPFGQSSSSSFGSQSAFGQTNYASNNPFAPKPFGSPTPFGAQSGGSIFGGTSTGVFGMTQPSSPLGSTPVFGAASSPAFGSSVPAFGASSTPGFGASSSSSFGGSSVFGQKPAFGGFGSSTGQTSPFGSSFQQQSQPAFGNNLFGSTPFGASSQPTFGTSSTPSFGSSSTPGFGATSAPAFGSTVSSPFGSTGNAFGTTNSPVFGSSAPTFGTSTTPAFGATSTPAFSSTPAFGATSTPTFGATSNPPFGATSTPAFGVTSNPAFGATSTPQFAASTTSAFGAQSSPSFGFGSTMAFGQSTSTFGNNAFGPTASSPFASQSSPFGAQASTSSFGSSTFGQTAFGGQRGGSRVAAYAPTAEVDSGSGTQPVGKLESISAMPVYKDKSHEELRWEDYQLGDKGGPAPASQPTGGITNPGFLSASTPAFGQSSANPFSASATSNLFAAKPPSFSSPNFASSTSGFNSSPFGASTTSNIFGATSSATPSMFGSTTFGTSSSPSIFGSSGASGFGVSTSIFGSSSTQAGSSLFGSSGGFGNTQSSPLFQSTTPSFGQTGSAFGLSTASFPQPSQSSLFSAPSTGFGGNLFSSSSSLLTTSNPMAFGQAMPSLSTSFQHSQPLQSTSAFGFGNFGQTQGASTNVLSNTPNIFAQGTPGQLSAGQNSLVAQPASVTNPFGTLPAMPQMSIGRTGASPSIQYGISSLPVVDKPAPVRISSLLTSRHLSQRRIRLPARKYHPKSDGPKVPFFSDNEETPSTPKADALFIPRENPRALVISPMERWPSKSGSEKTTPLKYTYTTTHENGKIPEAVSASPMNESNGGNNVEDLLSNDSSKERDNLVKQNQKPNGVHDAQSVQKGASIGLNGHRAGEAAIVYEHGADIEALMPKLRHSDYYTEPRIQELAAKERAEPGFCRRVKDFVVGRHGYGSIKFIGETDVRRLDLESLVQFNNREVIVYMDESKKPPVGQGLNKPAEVTLLNIKCFDKKTGQHYTEGPRIEKYKEMLKRKAEDQGAEFVSYDPVKGEWKFRVSHFSEYGLPDEDEIYQYSAE